MPFPPSSSVQASTDGGIGSRKRSNEGNGGLTEQKNILISVRLRLPPLLRSERRFLRSECRFLRPPPYRRRRTEGSVLENGATKETEANGAEKTFDLRSSSFASVAPF